ncbi:iron ABC transporter permease [Frankia sp. CN6]|uniref:Iron ABC transporter permease n=1 Tax=Frankia nepalensis TaxID=1836974 RepID=A0A937R607_9ACTN|nr:iron ABC transporter permease [Frankia nepalensis]
MALAGLAAGVLVMFVVAVAVGSVRVPLDETVRALTGADPHDPRWGVIVRQIRLPRAITAALAGAALSVAGLQMQTLFRNPLADPYSLGVSAGASLGVAVVVAGISAGGGTFTAGAAGASRLGMVAAGAIGAAAVLAVILVLARWVRSVVTLLVIGVVLSSAVSSLVSLMLAWTAPQRAQQYWVWQLGSFSGTSLGDLTVFAPVVGLGLAGALASVKPLNALLLGEGYARTMGVRVRRIRALTLVGASLLAGGVTAFCGPVAFLGITVPHVARRLLATSDHRFLMPGALLTGALVALACSVVAQLPGTDLLLPINIVTSLIGAPIVIAVLLRARTNVAGVA